MSSIRQNKILPYVSVIVPVRDGAATIDRLINSLATQDYPEDKREIIIVDNDSRDRTAEIAKQYSVILLQETRVHSSYAARNKGLSEARGEIIAFTDADCIPRPDWLSSGVRTLISEKADMAGGKVSFVFSASPTAAELFDSITFMQNEYNIEKKKSSVTANLFVRRDLFDKVGLFKEVQSGGDFLWTRKATDKGFALLYAPEAIVHHPARKLGELLRKTRRIGQGIKNREKRKLFYLALIIRLLIPIPSKNVTKAIMDLKQKLIPMFAVSYLCQLSQIVGYLSSFFPESKKQQLALKGRLF